MSMWQPINDDAKDGNDILGWRPDCGQFMCRWTAPMDFMSDSELEKLGPDDDWSEEYDFFGYGVDGLFRMDGDQSPILWTPLPDDPAA